jgi:hypothetical protein
LANREKKILGLLNIWPWKSGGVLIGGYAIAAYGVPRFSNDADIVISAPLKSTFEKFLREQGFEMEEPAHSSRQDFEGNVPRFRREETTVDLLVGYVRDRKAGVDIPEEWISKDSLQLQLKTITSISEVPVSVARPEAIWALKLQAGRDQDLLDLYAIFDVPIKTDEVISLFRSFNSETLNGKLSLTLEKVYSTKLFEDAMSRMGTKRTEKTVEKWQKFATKVRNIVDESVNA